MTPKLTVLFLILPLSCMAQEAIAPRPSAIAIVSARYKDTYLKVTYGQPLKKGRSIFGALVPYGQVWRTGANEATELTVTRDMQINGKPLKAGTYSLFTIPEKEKWTVILNSEPGLWGSYNYNEKLDVLRFEANVQRVKDVVYEPFTILIDQKNDKAEMTLLWDDVKVSFPVQFAEPKP